MKQQIGTSQRQALTARALGRRQYWCLEHGYEPPARAQGRRWDDGRLRHAPTIGQLLAYLAEHGRLDHDRWGLIVLSCEHGRLAGLRDARWAEAAAPLER